LWESKREWEGKVANFSREKETLEASKIVSKLHLKIKFTSMLLFEAIHVVLYRACADVSASAGGGEEGTGISARGAAEAAA
jgi:hypothetical protein